MASRLFVDSASSFPLKSAPRGALKPASHYFSSNEEPALAEVLSDPMVRSLMKSDGVARAHLDAVIASAQQVLRCN